MPRYEVNLDSPVVYFLGRELVREHDKASSEIELSDEEIASLRRVDREYWAWQERLSSC
jgi:hypothetical protein